MKRPTVVLVIAVLASAKLFSGRRRTFGISLLTPIPESAGRNSLFKSAATNERSNMRRVTLLTALLVILAACGGGSDGGITSGDTSSGDGGKAATSSGGNVVDQQPPGQAKATVDGQEFTFTEPGAVDCSVSEDAITMSFRIGDNEVTLGGGANLYDTGWLGGIDLIVFNPEGEDAPITYQANFADNGDSVAIDGDSISYSGPITRNDPDDPTNLDGISVGDGTITLTCG
ncbi:MAG: hypothetical protein WCA93_03400 [Acidimicrobiia bacterium]